VLFQKVGLNYFVLRFLNLARKNKVFAGVSLNNFFEFWGDSGRLVQTTCFIVLNQK